MTEHPLSGVCVVDFAGLLPGPWCSLMLWQLGADVTWVQRPGGDLLRAVDPGPYATLARGKQIVELDLKDAAAQRAMLALVDRADVVMEGYRPGVAKRLGVDAATLRARDPRLICCSLSGYGATGPYAQRPGHDINYLALAGILALSGDPAGPPAATGGVALADLAASLFATQAILAALLARQRSGEGASLEVPIAAAALKLAETRIAAAAHAHSPSKEGLMARGGYGAFRCADGRWLAIGCIEDHFWRNLCTAIGTEHLLDDERLRTYPGRCRHAAEVNAAIAEALRRSPLERWLECLDAADVPATAVAEPWALANEPQVSHWGLLDETGGARAVGLPYTGMDLRNVA